MRGYGIGELARRSGVRPANIRFYEESGLLPSPPRRAGGHRVYADGDLSRLAFIRNARELGFPLEQVRALLHLSRPENLTCDAAKALSQAQLDQVRERISDLRRIEAELVRHVAACEAACSGGRAPGCGVLEHGAGASP